MASLKTTTISTLALAISTLISGCYNQDNDYAITHVSVIPMTENTILENQTVLIRDGEIVHIGPANKTPVPATLETIDGTGRYLMPGLADMHTHLLCGSEDESCYLGKKEAEIYLAHGVTTVLNLQDTSGTDKNLIKTQMIEPIAAGELVGPHIYTASFAGGPGDLPNAIQPNQIVVTEQEGRDHVINSKTQGYDFIKVYDGVSAAAFHGIVDQARQEGMAVIGHFTQADPAQSLINGMDMVAHASAFFDHYFSHNPTPELINEAIGLSRANGVYINTTLTLPKKAADMACANEQAFQDLLNQTQTRYANPIELGLWRTFLYIISDFPGCAPFILENKHAAIQGYTKGFYDAGVKLVLGTDSPLVWGVPGYSAYEELGAISAIGLSPYQTLEIATRNAGEFIAEHIPSAQGFGTIEVGKRADLLLLENNPLTDLSHIQSQVGVMANGRWYSAEELETRLNNIATDYANMR